MFPQLTSAEPHIKNTLKYLIRALKQVNPNAKSAAQLRQSVIAEWLKVKGLRTVQYMAGHRYVSTTERYRANQLKDLQADLDQYHPLN